MSASSSKPGEESSLKPTDAARRLTADDFYRALQQDDVNEAVRIAMMVYGRRLFRYHTAILGRPDDADEILAETFTKFYMALSRGSRPAAVWPFLLTISQRTASRSNAKQLRIDKSTVPLSPSADSAEESAALVKREAEMARHNRLGSPQATLLEDSFEKAVGRFMAPLQEFEQAVLWNVVDKQMSAEQLAAAHGKTLNQVNNAIQGLRDKMRIALVGYVPDHLDQFSDVDLCRTIHYHSNSVPPDPLIPQDAERILRSRLVEPIAASLQTSLPLEEDGRIVRSAHQVVDRLVEYARAHPIKTLDLHVKRMTDEILQQSKALENRPSAPHLIARPVRGTA